MDQSIVPMLSTWNQLQTNGALALVALCASFLTACAESDQPARNAALVPVPVHGVNYSAETFSFVAIDPQDKRNRAGGELINPFGAGGTMCCVSLPATWRAGMVLEISETFWLPMKPDNSLPEFRKKHLVEVPPYPSGKAGELWVLRAADGAISVVSSNYQPDHQSWPGAIKGWPVPSIEYQRKLHDRAIHEARSNVDLWVRSLKDLSKNPMKHAADEWQSRATYRDEELGSFKSASDPAFLIMLRNYYQTMLTSDHQKLSALEASRP